MAIQLPKTVFEPACCSRVHYSWRWGFVGKMIPRLGLLRSNGQGGFRKFVYAGITCMLHRSEEGHIFGLEILHHALSL